MVAVTFATWQNVGNHHLLPNCSGEEQRQKEELNTEVDVDHAKCISIEM
jgi:hypothetical protein